VTAAFLQIKKSTFQ